MPRIRSVHPELCEDDTLATLTASAERTFVRLWCHLDDAGRAEDRPKLWKARLYPVHDSMTVERIEDDMNEIHAAGLLVRYEIDGKRYVCAKPDAWKRWQHPQRPTPTKLPEFTPTSVLPPRPVRDSSVNPHPVVEGREGETEMEGEGCGGGDRAEILEPDAPPQPPAERGEHDGSHLNCRGCGTNLRGKRTVPSWPNAPSPLAAIPDAGPILAEFRDTAAKATPMPEHLRADKRRASA